ncbi:unnamed protein product [Lasius platythorax]|uniref:Uncharacterized protein n=1 Tax=Lasius platythorax TaxID=488582 RepID=A0AAV2MXC7_9HYME
MCELFNQLTKARKTFIFSLDKKAKAVLENSKVGEFLFGSELSQRIKTAVGRKIRSIIEIPSDREEVDLQGCVSFKLERPVCNVPRPGSDGLQETKLSKTLSAEIIRARRKSPVNESGPSTSSINNATVEPSTSSSKINQEVSNLQDD